MFNKKIKPKIESTELAISENKKVIEKPRICLFDFSEDEYLPLIDAGYIIYNATLGKEIRVPNEKGRPRHFCSLNYDFPRNFHEYDVAVINLPKTTPIEYKPDEHIHIESKDFNHVYLLSEYPQTIFDPRPLSAHLLRSEISKRLESKFILIIFANRFYETDYIPVDYNQNGHSERNKETYNIYSFCSDISISGNKFGHESRILAKHSGFRSLFEKYQKNITYNVTFNHGEQWNSETRKYEKLNDFIPLLEDIEGEIISYLKFYKDARILVLPEIENKNEILLILLREILPEMVPPLFPYSTLFKWKENKDYCLPNYEKYIKTKELIKSEYEKKIADIDIQINDNNKLLLFLHDIICETGDKLVSSLKQYLIWLGFENIKIMDHESDKKEEDIQIEYENGLIVIEVKGIGGTSGDADCSQIAKIVNRRQKDRQKFDVHGIYVVNHQRYLPPLDRKNPPFSLDQIKDAEDDARGLLTTYQLFKLYFQIEDGVINKEDARLCMNNNGLISFEPKGMKFLGEIDKTYQNGTVFELAIRSYQISVGEYLLIKRNDQFHKVKIINIQVNKIDAKVAANCIAGIQVDLQLKSKSEVYKL